jgi:hypothetical protein
MRWVGQANHKKVFELLTPLLYKTKTGYLTKEEAAYNRGIIDSINPIVLMLERKNEKRKSRKRKT